SYLEDEDEFETEDDFIDLSGEETEEGDSFTDELADEIELLEDDEYLDEEENSYQEWEALDEDDSDLNQEEIHKTDELDTEDAEVEDFFELYDGETEVEFAEEESDDELALEAKYDEDDYDEIDFDKEEDDSGALIFDEMINGYAVEDDFQVSNLDEDLLGPHISAKRLNWPGASQRQQKFMADVYRRCIKRAAKKRSFIGDMSPDVVKNMVIVGSANNGKRALLLQEDAGIKLKLMLRAAREALGTNIRLSVGSAYRSATYQLGLWNQYFPKYYRRTKNARKGEAGGEHGEKATLLLAIYIGKRLAAPGFSNHQKGLAVDFNNKEYRKVFRKKFNDTERYKWRNYSQFWKWLNINAKDYNFYPYKPEPWHWVYKVKHNTLSTLDSNSSPSFSTVRNSNTLDDLAQKGKKIYLYGKAYYLAAVAISNGESRADKITDKIFYDLYPSKKGRKLQASDPLVENWKYILNVIVSPMLKKELAAHSVVQPSDNRSDNVKPNSIYAQVKLGGQYKLGTLGFNGIIGGKQRNISYVFDHCDLLMLAKLILGEADQKGHREQSAIAFCMVNNFALVRYKKREPTFWKFLQNYSTTLQPVFASAGAARRHYKKPGYEKVKPIKYYKSTNIPKGQIKKHSDIQKMEWEDIPEKIQKVALGVLNGTIKNPGVGIATKFANTTIYWRQKAGKRTGTPWRKVRLPTKEEWKKYNNNRKNRVWVGKIDGLQQYRTNSFFIERRFRHLDPDIVRIEQGSFE
ncbi:MAG: D-alanyl-D-alanine carboxypeptidase family protein, partial [Methylococcaceae bacterium]